MVASPQSTWYRTHELTIKAPSTQTPQTHVHLHCTVLVANQFKHIKPHKHTLTLRNRQLMYSELKMPPVCYHWLDDSGKNPIWWWPYWTETRAWSAHISKTYPLHPAITKPLKIKPFKLKITTLNQIESMNPLITWKNTSQSISNGNRLRAMNKKAILGRWIVFIWGRIEARVIIRE